VAEEGVLMPLVKFQSSKNTISIKYIEKNIENPHFIIMKILRVGKHHILDPIAKGIHSYSLSSLRG
jgi:hypothetical protein